MRHVLELIICVLLLVVVTVTGIICISMTLESDSIGHKVFLVSLAGINAYSFIGISKLTIQGIKYIKGKK